MKSRQCIIIATAFTLSLIFQNCKKSEFLPDLKGSLVGYVYTFDEFSLPFSDHSRVLIVAIGKNEVYRTFSDKEGRFEFENLPAGTYELHFEKYGFGTLKQFGIQHLGGEPTVLNMVFDHSSNGSAFFIYKVPTTEITNIAIERNIISCRCSFTKTPPDHINIQLFLSLQDNFDPQSTQPLVPFLRLEKSGDLYSGGLYYIVVYDRHDGLPFKPGDKVYFRACISPYSYGTITLKFNRILSGIETYFDYETNRIVYPALGKESAQFSYIMPQ
jgi:hypothetical protein